MVRFSAVMAALSLSGCGDTLLGFWAIESKIGSTPLPAGSEWEVRWVQQDGIAVDCTRIDAGVESELLAVAGTVVLPLPTMPEPQWVDAEGYRYALALPVLVEGGTPFPPAGNGSNGLDHDEGIWGTAAPMAWLQVEGDTTAAGNELLVDNGASPTASWVEVRTDLIDTDGDLHGVLDPVSDESLNGELSAVGRFWMEDDAYFLWSGADLGGIASTCEGS